MSCSCGHLPLPPLHTPVYFLTTQPRCSFQLQHLLQAYVGQCTNPSPSGDFNNLQKSHQICYPNPRALSHA